MDCEKPFTKTPSPYSKRNSPFTAIADAYSCYTLRLLLLEDGTNLLLESGVTIAL
jgi:hypothetical protein